MAVYSTQTSGKRDTERAEHRKSMPLFMNKSCLSTEVHWTAYKIYIQLQAPLAIPDIFSFQIIAGLKFRRGLAKSESFFS